MSGPRQDQEVQEGDPQKTVEQRTEKRRAERRVVNTTGDERRGWPDDETRSEQLHKPSASVGRSNVGEDNQEQGAVGAMAANERRTGSSSPDSTKSAKERQKSSGEGESQKRDRDDKA
jgi:hypothetical protein